MAFSLAADSMSLILLSYSILQGTIGIAGGCRACIPGKGSSGHGPRFGCGGGYSYFSYSLYNSRLSIPMPTCMYTSSMLFPFQSLSATQCRVMSSGFSVRADAISYTSPTVKLMHSLYPERVILKYRQSSLSLKRYSHTTSPGSTRFFQVDTRSAILFRISSSLGTLTFIVKTHLEVHQRGALCNLNSVRDNHGCILFLVP